MARYRRKPVEVEAIQFDPDKRPWPPGVHEIKPHWSASVLEYDPKRFGFTGNDSAASIAPGDWIVTNQTGEQYVVRELVFSPIYEEIKP